jgi:diacylglycerol kinase (ATP)
MTIKIIFNPYSARWTSLKRQSEMIAALEAANIDFDISTTEKPGHGIEQTKKAIKEGFKTIIAAGGDGTIQEVLNGIMKSSYALTLPTLGFIPLGTANDLIANLKLPTDINKAVKIISSGKTRLIDICQVNEHYFLNNAGLGLEPYITTVQERIKYPRGIPRYLLATIIGIAHNPQWEVEIKWDDGEYTGPVTMISVGNGARTGGLFYTVPNAYPFDGKLTFVYGSIQSRLEILKTLFMVMKPKEGNYTEHPAVNQIHCTWVKVHINPGTPAHSDGELFSKNINQLQYKIHPKALPIIIE